jgi:putative DNA primase/helicase
MSTQQFSGSQGLRDSSCPENLDWSAYGIGNFRVPCPTCARGASDRAAGLKVGGDGRCLLHCFRCGVVLTHIATEAMPGPRRQAAPQKPKPRSLSRLGIELWEICQPLSGIALEYLSFRKCRIPPSNGDLRWHPALKHPSGHVGPALVGLITDALTGRKMSLHRTWITPTGKAPINTPRLLLAGHSTDGGCIRLWPDEAVTSGLGVAEGIETGLSLAWGYTPVWSLIDAGHLAKLPVLEGVETLMIARDQDPAGTRAAQSCALRWHEAGREVYLSSQKENDLNDILTGEVIT